MSWSHPIHVALTSSHGILLVGLPGDAVLAAQPGRLGASPAIGAWRPALADPLVAGSLGRLVERAGIAAHFGLLEAVEYGIAHRALIAVVLPRAALGAPVAAAPVRPAPAAAVPFARMSATQRVAALLERTPSHLGPDLAAAFRRMVSVEALAGIAAAFVVLLAAQFAGVGEIADAALAWWAYTQAGLSGVHGLYEVLRAVVNAVRAPDEALFQQAVIRFAEGLSEVGVALLTAVVTRAARKRAGGAEGGGGEAASSFDRPRPRSESRRWTIAPAAAKPEPVVASAREGASSPIVKGGGLVAHEKEGGHLLRKHVGKTQTELRDRLAAEPGITSSSSFYDRATAERALSEALDANSGRISAWLSGSAGRLRIDYTGHAPVGISVARGASGAVDVSSTRAVLVRDPSMPTGYHILTGFPTTP